MTDLERLYRDVDHRFRAIRERHPERMACGAGCTDCCRCRLAVTHTEAAFIRRYLARLPRSVRRDMAARAESGGEMCPALDASGRCGIYAARPLACRTQGAPLRYRYPVAIIQPSRTDVCDKNFQDLDPGGLSRDDVVDQTQVERELAATDGGHRERIPLAQILADSV